MKTKDKASYRAMNNAELARATAELRKKISDAGIARTTREVKNIREGKELRKRLAVALTIANEKESIHE
ncbi:hypothetical protein A3A64_01645 [Candidatus Gottesmanbacteria bacterium RIFCSPLOWO2_01_FULL_48_11]|uniref:Large ribosomal subunit protein uL29 n=3 Tax=Candidatus Gottesmaniibacteriota TaxID=1752720 RepID=A0A1F6APG8_9BACT|nr:MAG: hypothetical protein A3A64_01645 [Candidatus Gottesmanbacteria bacterium RIFCSPLOWO2_01_FULL_48_11]